MRNLGFTLVREEGSHAHYECQATGDLPRSIVTVDMGYREFDDSLIKSMIRQSNRTREAFYGATKRTASKAAVKFVKLGASPDVE